MVQAGTDGLALNCLPLVGLQRSIGTGSQRRCISHPEISQECTTAAIAPVTALMRMAHQHCRPLPDGCTTLPLEAPTTPNQPHLVLWRRFDGWYPQAVLQRGVKPLVVLPHFLVAIYRLPNGALRVRGEGGKEGGQVQWEASSSEGQPRGRPLPSTQGAGTAHNQPGCSGRPAHCPATRRSAAEGRAEGQGAGAVNANCSLTGSARYCRL